MKLKLLRTTTAPTFTEGKLYIDDVHECYTVENVDRQLELFPQDKVYGLSAIPRGIYPISITYSPRFKRNLISINNVPNFTGVRFHSGNSSKDSDGCPVVGSTNELDDDDWVGGSRIAYKALHSKVERALSDGVVVTLEVL